MFYIFRALTEFERNLIWERTKAGLAAARGRKGGRPKALDEKKTQLLYKLYGEHEHTVKEICEMMGLSKSTLYGYLGERRDKEKDG